MEFSVLLRTKVEVIRTLLPFLKLEESRFCEKAFHFCIISVLIVRVFIFFFLGGIIRWTVVARDSRPFEGVIDFCNVSFTCLLEKLLCRDAYIIICIANESSLRLWKYFHGIIKILFRWQNNNIYKRIYFLKKKKYGLIHSLPPNQFF